MKDEKEVRSDSSERTHDLHQHEQSPLRPVSEGQDVNVIGLHPLQAPVYTLQDVVTGQLRVGTVLSQPRHLLVAPRHLSRGVDDMSSRARIVWFGGDRSPEEKETSRGSCIDGRQNKSDSRLCL